MLDSSCGTYSLSTGELNVELFGSSGDCIKILDLDGKLRHLNPGGVVALELAEPDQLLGKAWWSFWPDDTKPVAEAAFNAARDGRNRQFHAFCPTVQGTPRWWDVVTSPIHDADGRVKEVMVVSRDMTELFLAREELRKANQLKDELLATVAHELRNPISAAMTATDLLKLKEFGHDRVTEFAGLIQRQLNHMSRIAEDLLDASRISRGEIGLDLRPLSMKSVVAETLEQLDSAYRAKQQLVSLTLPEDDCMVMGDSTRLVQVAGNLLANAIRYTPANGVIQVALSRMQDAIELSITDSGIGIEPERIAGIFDLYVQGSKSSVRKKDGLGLGLSLVKGLVTAHGGSVKVESKGRNLGSRFAIQIPAIDQM
jgi:PAS domain S-box-containing protein